MDNTGRKLKRGVKHGDNPVGAIMHGARTGDIKIVSDAISAALSSMDLFSQRKVLQKVADSIRESKKTEDAKLKKPMGSTKAFEIHGPEVGQVTLEEFVSIIFKAVDDAMIGKDNKLIGYSTTTRRGSGWYRQKGQLNKKQLKQHLEEVFGEYTGSFKVSCSSPIRVYAMHEVPSEEELERRKKEKDLIKAQEILEKKRKALEAASEKEKRLKAELAKLAKDEKRYKKNLEKAEEELEQLKSTVDGV